MTLNDDVMNCIWVWYGRYWALTVLPPEPWSLVV